MTHQMPAMTNGTDKQIAYAEKVRAAAIKSLENTARARTGNDEAQVAYAMEAALENIATKTSTDAIVWLDAKARHQAFFNDDGSLRHAMQVLADVRK